MIECALSVFMFVVACLTTNYTSKLRGLPLDLQAGILAGVTTMQAPRARIGGLMSMSIVC